MDYVALATYQSFTRHQLVHLNRVEVDSSPSHTPTTLHIFRGLSSSGKSELGCAGGAAPSASGGGAPSRYGCAPPPAAAVIDSPDDDFTIPLCKRGAGRPPTRWTDDLVTAAGSRWTQAAASRSDWKSMGEAYVQQWTSYG
ncbi:hypothetical protein MSG28_010537 [Choristoneura fumiferana]|uniref:Uncharacterized protein n=1 Tax=Choristoneura fumiferana TaxID=7141 RepID=A0ACC0KLN2_CHOFU|nr:hypothetical protein MSG28_010537 [Choristoneura fumiferana]